MENIRVEFDPISGLSFYNPSSADSAYHVVSIDTLKQMSLSDLEYCIFNNCFSDLGSLHELFSEYLWTDEGEVEPQKKRDEPR